MIEWRLRWIAALALPLLVVPAFVPASTQASIDVQAHEHSLARALPGDSRTFPETGQSVSGRFLEYWNTHGGLAQQGYPISSEMQEKSDTDGKVYTVQYFERAVFELHPENQPPNDVLLSLLGNFFYKQKYPNGAPNQQANNSAGSVLFSQTGHRLGGVFLQYWNSHGGLAQQGYPISDEFQERSDTDGKVYTVQYFERAVFEYHTENQAPNQVLLSLLGTFHYKSKYGAGGPEANVQIKDFEFVPATITVTAGTKVTWVHVGPTEHNTVNKTNGTPSLWESPILMPGQKYSFTFTIPGEYDYWCTIHPNMLGKIVVVQP